MPHSSNGTSSSLFPPRAIAEDRSVPNEECFHRMISVERKRTARSQKPFLLMLLDMKSCLPSNQDGRVLAKLLSALASSTRETDVTGWYKDNSIIGVMFTEIGTAANSIMSTMLTRVGDALRTHLPLEQLNQISISFHLFPEERNHETPQRRSNPILYPDLARRDNARSAFRVTKRMMDIVGSIIALIVCAPLFAVIAAAIKLTSKGPVFFRQSRVGQYGVPFVFLKFRSMHTNNDPSVHRGYVRDLIAGQAERKPSNGKGESLYKLTNDSRVTKVGAFLRKTSLDELPQFFNVLKGEMSLVGPRPPIPYEVEVYDIWHRRRLLEALPGITGLWQVNGRSRVKFDEMVRLDLRYAQTWTPWLDVKILARTPRAVLFNSGAC